MRWLALYLQQLFCRHQFDYQEAWCEGPVYDWTGWLEGTKRGPHISALCRTCSYHYSFWKY